MFQKPIYWFTAVESNSKRNSQQSEGFLPVGSRSDCGRCSIPGFYLHLKYEELLLGILSNGNGKRKKKVCTTWNGYIKLHQLGTKYYSPPEYDNWVIKPPKKTKQIKKPPNSNQWVRNIIPNHRSLLPTMVFQSSFLFGFCSTFRFFFYLIHCILCF